MTGYAVETFASGRWAVRRFVRLSAAIRFREAEMVRTRMGLDVVRVNADLTSERLTAAGWKPAA